METVARWLPECAGLPAAITNFRGQPRYDAYPEALHDEHE